MGEARGRNRDLQGPEDGPRLRQGVDASAHGQEDVPEGPRHEDQREAPGHPAVRAGQGRAEPGDHLEARARARREAAAAAEGEEGEGVRERVCVTTYLKSKTNHRRRSSSAAVALV